MPSVIRHSRARRGKHPGRVGWRGQEIGLPYRAPEQEQSKDEAEAVAWPSWPSRSGFSRGMSIPAMAAHRGVREHGEKQWITLASRQQAAVSSASRLSIGGVLPTQRIDSRPKRASPALRRARSTRRGGGSRSGTHRPRRAPSAPGQGSGSRASGTRPRTPWSLGAENDLFAGVRSPTAHRKWPDEFLNRDPEEPWQPLREGDPR